MGRLDFLFKDSNHIEEAQLIQDDISHLTVKLVRSSEYSNADEAKFLHEMRRYLGKEISIDINYVSEVPRESNGKFRQIVSKVFEDQYAEGITA